MHRKMSLRAILANKYIERSPSFKRGQSFKKHTDEEIEKMLIKRLKRGARTYNVPINYLIRSDFKTEREYGYEVLYFNNNSSSGRTFFYLHGGAFTSEITLFHCRAIEKIAVQSDSKAVVPLYPLIPFADYRETVEFVENVYLDYKEKHPDERIIFMGDSAGGGLSLTMSEIFAKKEIPRPKKLIVFSPWVDVSMSNPGIEEYTERDVMLYPESLIYLGKKWAGDISTKDYRVSPRFGDLSVIDDITFYVGTEEILYPDVTETYELIKAFGNKCTIRIGENMTHVYPILPIPEGHEALKMCADELRDT